MTAGNGVTNPFTDEQWKLLLRMKEDGKSWTEIGAACGHGANSCAATFYARKPVRKGTHRPWTPEDAARLKYMRDVQHMPFQKIAPELGRSISACETKYNVMRDSPAPIHGYEPGLRVSVTPAALADRDARYQAWLRQPPAAALMGDPVPGRSALDQRRQSEAQ